MKWTIRFATGGHEVNKCVIYQRKEEREARWKRGKHKRGITAHSNDRKGKRDFCDTTISVDKPLARYKDGRKDI